MKLIVGLGNPGKEYDGTRHNAGFLALTHLASERDLEWKKEARRHAVIAQESVNDETLLFAMPQTFMNESGSSVQGFASFFHIAPEDILVVHDEMDLAPGRISFIAKGGHAGHNGVRDIQEKLGTDAIARLRIGVGRPTPPIEKEDWVLMKPTGDDKDSFVDGIEQASQAIMTWGQEGLTAAMNEWNGKNS